ncbi:beta-1,4-galactosyltransferase 6 isoform X1 [Agrilus planipennis]|uniref:Beta-1,4-galactosyltransferase 6 isoform X1 n=1 Tax=Agrilus planipennis TaxID=224129 RepID=A0A7F5RCK7_AGRPL|nr:beta-1,4-galactosyltransferase 6 isoform X1 [Agrilus planipennis]
MYKKIAFVVAVGSVVFFLFHPYRHAKYYSYLNARYIYDELVQYLNKNESEKFVCKDNFYKELINNNQQYNVEYILNNVTLQPILPGGEYIPLDCKARFKSAIIVPYRNRDEHLKIFLKYISRYMQLQKIHYRVFVIEQMDTGPFNRGKLLNIGAQEALKNNFSCFFLHDVDLLPLNSGHLYACSNFPRHLASGMDTLRYHLPYLGFTGGVFSITAEQYLRINGMSNRFIGWGGEDDDLYVFRSAFYEKFHPC